MKTNSQKQRRPHSATATVIAIKDLGEAKYEDSLEETKDEEETMIDSLKLKAEAEVGMKED